MSKISVSRSGHYMVRTLYFVFRTIFVVCIAALFFIALAIIYFPDIYGGEVFYYILFVLLFGTFLTGPLIFIMWMPLRKDRIDLKNNVMKFEEIFDNFEMNIKSSSPKIIDSVDLELLNIINQCNGDLIEIEKQVDLVPIFTSKEDFYIRIVKLNVLNYIFLNLETLNIKLSSLSLDALNTPLIFYKTTLPELISKSVYGQKISIINQKYTDSVYKCAQICEMIMRNFINEQILNDDKKRELLINKYKNFNLNRSTLGELIGFSRTIRLFSRNSIEDASLSHINKIRNKIHVSINEQPEEITAEDSYICDMLLEILLRKFY